MRDIVPAESPVTQALSMIERASRDPSVDIAKMQALQEMQLQLIDRQKVQIWHQAVAMLPPMRVKKSGVIDLGKGRAVPFARWEDIDDVLRPLLTEQNLFLTFDSDVTANGWMTIRGALRHITGHSLTASISLPQDQGPGRNNLQAWGSTLSYGKRYVAEMLLNIVREGDDDDGKLAGTKFITGEQAEELRTMAREVGRQEGALLDSFFAGKVHTFEEVEDGQAYIALRNGLQKRVADKRSQA